MSDWRQEAWNFGEGMKELPYDRSFRASARDRVRLVPTARTNDPITSHQAAADAKRGAATLRSRCLAALRAAGDRGLDDFALAEITHSQQTSAGKRRGELVRAGLVEATDERRLSPSGSKVIVWRIVAQ